MENGKLKVENDKKSVVNFNFQFSTKMYRKL